MTKLRAMQVVEETLTATRNQHRMLGGGHPSDRVLAMAIVERFDILERWQSRPSQGEVSGE
jgi:hypothetical protein